MSATTDDPGPKLIARVTSPRQKLVSGVLVAAATAAFVVCAVRSDIPLVPVV